MKIKLLLISLISSIPLFGMTVNHTAILPTVEVEVVKKVVKEEKIDPTHDFAYVKVSAFPRKVEDNIFGISVGYRMSHSEKMGTDYSFIVMHDYTKNLILATKADHLFYARDKSSGFSPYFGFGVIVGLGPAMVEVEEFHTHFVRKKTPESEFMPFVNGEIVMGCEYMVRSSRQFFELTYFANSSTFQMSLGLGF